MTTDTGLVDDIRTKHKALIEALNVALAAGLSVQCWVDANDIHDQYERLSNRKLRLVREKPVSATRTYT